MALNRTESIGERFSRFLRSELFFWLLIGSVGLLDASCVREFVLFKPQTPSNVPGIEPTAPNPAPTTWFNDLALGAVNLLALYNIVDRRIHTARQKGKA